MLWAAMLGMWGVAGPRCRYQFRPSLARWNTSPHQVVSRSPGGVVSPVGRCVVFSLIGCVLLGDGAGAGVWAHRVGVEPHVCLAVSVVVVVAWVGVGEVGHECP